MKRSEIKKILLTLLVFFLIALLLYPIVIMVSSSFKTYTELNAWPPKIIPENPTLENYREVLAGQKSIMPEFKVSLEVALSTMAICVLLGTLAAYAVTRFTFIGKKTFLVLIIITQMFSPVILINAMYLIFLKLSLLDNKLALIIPSVGASLPMTVWLLYSYFQSIPISYEEASWMDGSTRIEGIFNVMVPLMLPGIITSGLFAFIVSWGDIVFSRTFLVSRQIKTISMALLDFQDLYKTAWEKQMAGSVIASIPVFIIFIFIQKYLIKGLSGQGVKS